MPRGYPKRKKRDPKKVAQGKKGQRVAAAKKAARSRKR
jgi:hypothetical protein